VVESTLYGLSDQVQLIQIDPATAKSVTLGVPVPSELQAQSLASFDKLNNIYYFVGFNTTTSQTQLVGLSVTGTIGFTYDLPFPATPFIGIGQYVAVDPKSSDVIVIGITQPPSTHTILRVDTDFPHEHKTLGSFDALDVLGAFSAYDGNNDRIYVEVANAETNNINILGFNAHTGKLEQTLDDIYIVETLAWDPKSGLLYGIGLNVSDDGESFQRSLVSLDGKSGKFQVLALLPEYRIISASISTFDPVGRILYSFLTKGEDLDTFYLVGVNVDTGKVVSSPQACANDAECPWSIEWDS